MNIGNIRGDFFKGNIRFISQGLFNAKYSIVDNGTIIKVKNSTHVRLTHNQSHFPEIFEIIAPLDAVQVINGSIPDYYIHSLLASEYLRYRMIYQGV
jgi:hypothetical protein